MNEFPEGTLSLPHIGSGTSDSTYLIYAPRGCAGILRIPHLRFASESQSDQNTVAKYRPCSSTFYGNCSFCTLPNVFACQNSLKHFASHFYTLAGNSLPPRQCTQEIPRNNVLRIKIIEKCVCVLYLGRKYLSASATSGKRGAFGLYTRNPYGKRICYVRSKTARTFRKKLH